MTSKVTPSETSNSTTKIESRVGPETKFFTNAKGKKIHCSYWKPNENTQIRGVVFICHGFGEHLQWYEDLALKLTATGLLAFGHDHVGHGKSEGVRGYVESVDEYVEDVLKHSDDVRAGHPGLPCFIVGHSMGGMITIKAAMTRPNYFTGVVLVGPLIKANAEEATTPKIFLAKLVARILPYVAVAKVKLELVTRDEEIISRLRKDPLRYQGGVKARWAIACLECLLYIENHISEVEWPFFIIHGEKDKLCDPQGSQLLADQAKSTDKSLKIFPNAYHHLYLEYPDVRHEALQDTVDWIAARVVPQLKISEKVNNSEQVLNQEQLQNMEKVNNIEQMNNINQQQSV